jgi:predicted ATPase/transcriptional regulator with XRE-family HTH domain
MPTASPGSTASTASTPHTFGALLRHLRRRAGLTQAQLAARVGFSVAQISLLEKDRRLPDLTLVATHFAPALGLDQEPRLRRRLLDLAAAARGQSTPPAAVRVRKTVTVAAALTEEWVTPERASQEQGPQEQGPQEQGACSPAAPTPLLGRRRELDAAIARLTHSSGRLLTLLGPPGVGKTHLALAIAEHMQPFFAGGVCHLPLANVATPAGLAPAIAAALGVRDRGRHPAPQRLADHLRHQELLLVLDDFEHLLAPTPAASDLLAHLLAACPRLHVLVTSRAPLRLRAEQRLKVPPLDPAAAVELFLQRAAAVEVDYSPSPADLAVIAEICLRLDCLPLAVELIAARIDLLSPRAMLARLADNRLDLLAAGPKDLPPHQRTLRRALDRSYTLLDPAEQQLFRRAAIFPGSFDLAAVEASLDLPHAADLLQALLAKSLIRAATPPDPAPPGPERRFVLLETLRAYALEQLHAHGEHPAQAARHAACYASLAARLAPAATAQLAADAQNLTAALAWLLDRDLPAAAALVGDLRNFWYAAGRFEEGRRWAEAVLAAAGAPSAPTTTAAADPPAAPLLPPTLHAGVLLTLGQMQLNQGDTAAARTCLAAALALFRRAGATPAVARTLIELGWAVYLAHDQAASQPLFRECLDLAESLGDAALAAHALTSLAHVLVYEGAYTPQLLAYITQSIALYRRLDDPHGLAQALLNLAVFHTQTGDRPAALAAAAAALATSDGAGVRAWAHAQSAELLLIPHESPGSNPNPPAAPDPDLDASLNAGIDASLEADLDLAQAHLEAALAHFQAANQRDGVSIVQHHLGDLARRRGRLAEAAALYTASHAAALAGDDRRMVARCHMGLGLTALAAGDLPTARTHLAAGRALLAGLPAILPPPTAAEYAAAWAALSSPA